MKRASQFFFVLALSFVALSFVAVSFAAPVMAQSYEACGDLANAFGPLDYRKASAEHKQLVEGAHFLPFVERLQRGNTSSTPGGDIDYTLRVFPNHPRALLSMMRLAERENTDKPRGSRWSMECWFDRAIRFQEEDGTVRMLYGTYLARKGKNKEAIEQLELASKLLGDEDGNAHYNLGLAYIEVKQYDKALIHAHKAYALGFDLPGLRNKLQRVGKWQDPPPAPKTAAALPPPVPAETAKPVEATPGAPAGESAPATPSAPIDAKPGAVNP